MNLKYLTIQRLATVVTAATLALCIGCSLTDTRPKPVVAALPQDQPPTSSFNAGPVGPPDGLSLFGDRPDYEPVPFENRLITNLTRHTSTTEGLDFDPDIFDQANLLVFSSTRNSLHPDVFIKDVDGATLTQLTADPADDIQPRFSPDGRRVVFCSNRTGNWDVWIVNRDGTGLMQLTNSHCDEVAPCFSPDGQQVAYTRWGDRSRQWEIWVLQLNQPGVRQFLAYGMFPAWSPDGQLIAFQRARQRGSHLFSVWTMRLVNGEARQPTEVAHVDSAACIAPRWSPDGSMLVYCVVDADGPIPRPRGDTPTEANLWVVDVDTGVRLKLTDGTAPAFNPVWAQTGRIFFVSPQSGTENVWSLTAQLGGYAGLTGQDTPRVTMGPQQQQGKASRD